MVRRGRWVVGVPKGGAAGAAFFEDGVFVVFLDDAAVDGAGKGAIWLEVFQV